MTISDDGKRYLGQAGKEKSLTGIDKLVALAKDESTEDDVRFSLGVMPNFKCQAIKASTGISIHGLERYITCERIRHIIKRHAKDAANKRSQADFEDRDFSLIQMVLNDPDKVEKGNKIRGVGETLKFTKEIKGKTYYVIGTIQGFPDPSKMIVTTAYIKE